MEWLVMIFILVWYGMTGIREGLNWSKNKDQKVLGIKHEGWIGITTLSSLFFLSLTTTFALSSNIWILGILVLIFLVWCSSNFSLVLMQNSIDEKIESIFGIDYHGHRALEGLGIFIPCWFLSGNFWLVSAFWIFGNWGYKKLMNVVMFNNFWHYSDIHEFQLFGKKFPYGDWYYDASLFFGIFALLIALFL